MRQTPLTRYIQYLAVQLFLHKSSGKSGRGPKTFPIFFEIISTGNTSILLKYFQFRILIYHLPAQHKLQIVLFVVFKPLYICFIVTLSRNEICNISFLLASKFNNEIYKNSATSGSLRPQSPCKTHWGLPYSKPMWLGSIMLGLGSAHDQDAERMGTVCSTPQSTRGSEGAS